MVPEVQSMALPTPRDFQAAKPWRLGGCRSFGVDLRELRWYSVDCKIETFGVQGAEPLRMLVILR